MKLTKQTKVYAGILGLGLIALVADRALFTPAGASAAVEATPLNSAPAADIVAARPATPVASTSDDAASVGTATISERLRVVAKEAEKAPEFSGDAFAPPVTTGQSAPAARVAPASAELFKAQYRLTGLVHSGNTGAAIIDGKPVRVGESIGGFTLTRVDASGATFELDGQQVTLTAPEFASSRGSIRKEIDRGTSHPLK